MMNIRFVTITVKNLEESLNFYKEILDLKEIKRFSPQEAINIVFLKDEGSGMIELIEYQKKPKNHQDSKKSLVSIGLGVVDLQKTLDLLKDKGIEILRGPIEVPSGEKFAFINDPNGVEIELIQGFNI